MLHIKNGYGVNNELGVNESLVFSPLEHSFKMFEVNSFLLLPVFGKLNQVNGAPMLSSSVANSVAGFLSV